MSELTPTIHPALGFGALRLGSTQADVRALLGEPATFERTDYGDGIDTHDWRYPEHGISLSFSADDDLRLGAIAVESKLATLNGERLIGLSESELLASDFGGLGPPRLDDDFADLGCRDYLWDAVNTSCWLVDGFVTSVTIMPRYDESGEVPQWPDATG